MRGAWVAYYEIAQSAGGVSKSAFIKKADALFKKMADYGINTVFLHVRPFSDAIYPSKLAPWSDILTGTQGGNPGYDPLQIFCDLAAQYRLALHAWINPFRISRNDDLTKLAASNPALAHIEANDGWVRKTGGQYYWNPAMPETHALIYAAVKELLGKYSLAGLHIDDYFYPTTAASFDAAQYKAYQTAGGKLALGDWRREMVSLFVQGLYRTAKQAAPGAVVSISPAGNLKTVRTEMFADVPRWMAEPGYADWMIPQVYFGFENAACPFAKTASDWAALPRHSGLRLLFGLAAYKCGQTDAYAGAGKEEWKTNSDILARQLKKIRTLNGYSGFSLFSYEFIGKTLSGIALQERENFQKMLTATH
ncbi:MAG: family 10 glycosylhydrolase [Oscillospiraceae bacterium]|nr:family 10 glycosylhydrolase [Oscillospiraceae bacterium]